MLASGRLDKLVTIQRTAGSKDAEGQIIESPEAITHVWAEITPLSGREYWTAKAQEARTSHKITIQYLAGLTTEMQVVYSGRTFRIESIINPGERNELLELMAVEVVA